MAPRPACRLLLVLLAGAATTVGACRSTTPVDVGKTAKDARTRIEGLVVATGTIEPEKKVEVRPRISGIVEKVHVDDGDVVDENQPLLEIDRELLEAQAAEARSRLEASKDEQRYAEPDRNPPAAWARGG